MKKEIRLSLTLAGLFLALILLSHSVLERWIFELVLNQSAGDFFHGSLRAGSVRLDRHLKIHVGRLQGKLQTETGPFPLEVRQLESQAPLSDVFFSPNGLLVSFEGIRPQDSKREGIRGIARLRGGRKWFFELRAEVEALDLEELKRLSLENWGGSTGEMKGKIVFLTGAQEKSLFLTRLRIEPPGGQLRAHFLNHLTPYIPKPVTRQKVKDVLDQGGLVDFRTAFLEIRMEKPDLMKVFFRLAVPSYNLHLNLNLEIRVDEKNGFAELAQLF